MTASASIDPGRGHAEPVDPAPGTTAPRRLLRSRTNRVFAGVCGGIAEYYGADPTAVRLLAVLIAVFTAVFPLLIVYLVAAIIVPEGEGNLPGVPVATPTGTGAGRVGLFLGIVLIFVGLAALADEILGIRWDLAGPLLLVGLGVAFLVSARPR